VLWIVVVGSLLPASSINVLARLNVELDELRRTRPS
jgi:hypothetical protein